LTLVIGLPEVLDDVLDDADDALDADDEPELAPPEDPLPPLAQADSIRIEATRLKIR
jgi:hypothetical protein